MKIILLLSTAALLCNAANATEFKFTYVMGQNKLEFKTEAKTWEEAFGRGSQFCFNFFVKKEKALSEEKGLDIIDACANPR